MKTKDPGSFRDPSGFVFYHKDGVYRQVNTSYKDVYKRLQNSGFLKELVESGDLISFDEVKPVSTTDTLHFKTIQVEKIPFISYPYEWSFSQLKDAALLTLKIQKHAVESGFSLKDASAYNIQFFKSKPVFIDLLSFEDLQIQPWVAYRQFCQHFLAPLALAAYVDIRSTILLRDYIDGIPLDLAVKLLPKRSMLKPGIFMHLHLHAKSQKENEELRENKKTTNKFFTKHSLLGILQSLEKTVQGLSWNDFDTEWGDYYNNTNYDSESFVAKKKLVKEFMHKAAPDSVCDWGGNNGEFSRLASGQNINTVLADIDPAAIEKCYLYQKKHDEPSLLPIVHDLTNPSPGIGWMNDERMSIMKRSNFDLGCALALIHHLSISNNLPFSKTAEFFAKTSKQLIIEFVPKSDSQVKKLLSSREDIFDSYTQAEFEKEYAKRFTVITKKQVPKTERTLYLMKRK